jgi:hypothetical protein
VIHLIGAFEQWVSPTQTITNNVWEPLYLVYKLHRNVKLSWGGASCPAILLLLPVILKASDGSEYNVVVEMS